MSRSTQTPRGLRPLVLAVLALGPALATPSAAESPLFPRGRAAGSSAAGGGPTTMLIGIGDSLTHGTMDGTNNFINTENAYLERVADSLSQVLSLTFDQPLFDLGQNRIDPFAIPTNLAVDGEDSFSAEGYEYYKRVGADQNYISDAYLCDKVFPLFFEDKHDKVLYPINLLDRQDVSQIDSAVWLLDDHLSARSDNRAVVVYWMGNNDSSGAALGSGGANPLFYPFPYELVRSELLPILRLLIDVALDANAVAFDPYTPEHVDRGLTEVIDFAEQNAHLLDRLLDAAPDSDRADFFIITLPYYSAVGYLMDSQDLEYYLRKLDPAYSLPPTFARVDPNDPMSGDRVSLFTFGMMFGLMGTGHTADYANQALEVAGVQNDGLVLSEAEARYIAARIDEFNAELESLATSLGPNVHLVDIGGFLNAAFLGEQQIIIGDRTLTRNWMRGGGFSFDGVHPGYTAAALIANLLLDSFNSTFGWSAPLEDLEAILQTDPYQDFDGDGFAPGPDYDGSGLTEVLYLFKDPDDGDADAQPVVPPDFWEILSRALLDDLFRFEAMREMGRDLGIDR